jgi:hypothetical protein
MPLVLNVRINQNASFQDATHFLLMRVVFPRSSVVEAVVPPAVPAAAAAVAETIRAGYKNQNPRRTGIAYLPLHGGKAPAWLFQSMVQLAREITIVIVDEYGAKEMLKSFGNP